MSLSRAAAASGDRSYVVTGGAQGVGRAIARRLAAAAAVVVIDAASERC